MLTQRKDSSAQYRKGVAMNSPSLQADGVHFAYHDHRVLTDIDIELEQEDMIGLIGPNGSGKSTLIKVLSGYLPPIQGCVRLHGRDLSAMQSEQIAQHIAVVPQELHMPFAFTAWEMVMIGRTACINRLRGETDHDHRIVTEKMKLTNTFQFADRVFNELSGGEQQRVVVAMALAQEPDILLLDEPTVHLDIRAQIEILELVRQLNRQTGMLVLAAMHDLNQAALYFDKIIMLRDGEIIAQGTPLDVLDEGHIQHVFQTAVLVRKHPVVQAPLVVMLPFSPDFQPPEVYGIHSINSPCNIYNEYDRWTQVARFEESDPVQE